MEWTRHEIKETLIFPNTKTNIKCFSPFLRHGTILLKSLFTLFRCFPLCCLRDRIKEDKIIIIIKSLVLLCIWNYSVLNKKDWKSVTNCVKAYPLIIRQNASFHRNKPKKQHFITLHFWDLSHNYFWLAPIQNQRHTHATNVKVSGNIEM